MASGSSGVASVKTSSAEWLERERRHNSGLWAPDLVLERGSGALLYDADGNEYIDMLAGIAVASLGHAHPRLTAAIAEQAGKLISCPQYIVNEPRTRLSEKLFEFLQPPLARVFYANSGAEANEAALKWARAATGRSRFVALRRGFSGRTMGVLPLTWERGYREPFGPYPFEVEFVEAGDVAALERAVDERTAGVLIEPIQGESGVRPVGDDFLRAARRSCDATGALLILDEIQSGVGRTGTFLASETAGIAPDMVTLAKGLGGGVPIGAVALTEAVALSMPKGGHGTTFGGNALAAAAAVCVLEEIESAGLMERAARLGESLVNAIEALDSPLISAVRGRGLLIGIELTVDAGAPMRRLRDAGVLTTNAGANVIRFLPPLNIPEDLALEAVARLGRALSAAPDTAPDSAPDSAPDPAPAGAEVDA